jgi:hypothetical protein
VTAAGSVLAKCLEVFTGAPDPKSQDQVREVMGETYDTLRGLMTDGCVKVLRRLESGSLLYPQMIRESLYPNIEMPTEAMTFLDKEFGYRLEYLRQCGVLNQVAGREYGITRLGLAFLEEARRRKDYYQVLFGD